jgi:hypothetical protein
MNHAQLLIGSHTLVRRHTEQYLQQIFCPTGGCSSCTTCMQIHQRQHHACLWFYPENNYTLETLKPFFTIITRSLEHQEKFFFIFEHADYLSTACSNSLLKSIEEPPQGYYILFLAESFHAVAPTLRSRCTLIRTTNSETADSTYDLVQFFTSNSCDIELFLHFLEKIPGDDRTTLNTIKQILDYWIDEYKKKTNYAQESTIEKKIKIINDALKKLPMPGSNKVFWKNLFLKMQ